MVKVFNIKCLSKVLEVGVMKMVNNRDKGGSFGNKPSIIERVDRKTFRWFGVCRKGFIGQKWMR